MKNIIYLSCAILILVGSSRTVVAQCEPDTVNCKDVLAPGEICPLILPEGVVNEPFEQVFTIIPPSEFNSILGKLEIAKITIDSVGNLPPGLSYVANADTFYADTAYCILVSGTPTMSGIFDLEIIVTPYIYITIGQTKMLLEGDPIADDTSLTVIIREPSGLDDFYGTDFALLEASPNPFRSSSRIGYFTRNQGPCQLRIYDLLGQLIYSEKISGAPGKNYFMYNGNELRPGTYLYNISGNGKSITRKLIRLQ